MTFRKNDHVCVHCGMPMTGSCPHVAHIAPGWCVGEDDQHEMGWGDHSKCPGEARDKPVGSCPCSCHVVVTDEEMAAAAAELLQIQTQLEASDG